jgi:hypothetical protein
LQSPADGAAAESKGCGYRAADRHDATTTHDLNPGETIDIRLIHLIRR